MSTLTHWILAHKQLVSVFWLIVAVVSLASTSSASNALTQGFALPGMAGYETNQTILHTYGNGGINPPAVAVITLPAGTTVDITGVRSGLAAAFSRVQAAVPQARIVSYASTGNRMFVSADGRTTYGLLYLPPDPGTPDTTISRQTATQALTGVRIDGAQFQVTGRDALASGGGSGGPSVLIEALIGSLGALLVLAFVFGSFLAVIPLLMAIVAIPTTFLLVWGLTAVTQVSYIVEFLIALIGLGIAIDYSLLIVMRWREERANGLENKAAIHRAMETAGTAVVFSGTTVAVGLLALVVLPVPFLRSIGYGGMLIPLVSVLVATTLLPILLATIGPRIDWPRRTRPPVSAFWSAWGRLMVRRRWLATGVASLILAALVIPAFSISVGNPTADSLAGSGEAYQGLQSLERSGIGSGVLSPFELLVQRGDPRAVAGTVARIDGVLGAVAPDGTAWQRGGSALVVALPRADGASAAARSTLDRLRQAVKAPAVRIGGVGAQNADFIQAVYGNFPLMIALIVVISFLLLARAFRSLLLPLKAVVLVLVSVGAAWGLITLIWQDGYGSQAIWGIKATGSITAFIPLLVFAFLFGISMDYEVFMLARMREEYDRNGSTDSAVVRGVTGTGRLVTSAALILFLAFASLAASPETVIKIFATGLAMGILLDATVSRMLLVPALVSLLGRWNWWLPTATARLLRVQPSPLHSIEDDNRTLKQEELISRAG